MKPNPDFREEPDDLLEQVVHELRNQPVPPMPSELRDFAKVTVATESSSKRVRTPILLLAVAAAALLVASATYFAIHDDSEQLSIAETPNDTTTSEDTLANQGRDADGIVLVELSSSPALAALDTRLDELNEQIGQLRRQAELLDARRRVTELASALAVLD